MKTFAINTLGCKVNQYESQQIRELLERHGLDQVRNLKSKPDIVVVNTCCVTHTATAKSRRCIRKTQTIYPDSVIVVTGCLPVILTCELNNLRKNIHVVKHRHSLAATLGQIINGRAPKPDFKYPQNCQNTIKPKKSPIIKNKSNSLNLPKLTALTTFKGQTRAFLKIQDGCDGYCSYCIIPQTRPYVHSKDADAVLKEARNLVKAGHKEIVLTGVFLGAYGQTTVRRKCWVNKPNDKLTALLDKLAEISNLSRIRLSSLEPADVTEHMLDILCKHRNIMPHLHLSLQSGSDAVLKRMCRQYNAEEFLSTVALIKSRLDRPAITADIIVGFPGETEADFKRTIDVAKQTGFAKMHVFSFSPRKGTAAERIEDSVSKKVMKERSRLLRGLGVELGRKFREQFIGETATVLIENSGPQPSGRSERYFMVYIEQTARQLRQDELVTVKLVKNVENGVIGEAL